MNIRKIKNEFPVFARKYSGKKLIYFDNACTLLKPKPVIKAVCDYYQNLGVCSGDRSSHQLSWQVQEEIEEAREAVKEFINASSSKEIIWTRNSTEGINLVAASFPLEKQRNEVILTVLEHHSNLLPFYEQSRRRRFKIKILPINKDGTLDLGLLKKAISKKTALVAVSHLSNVTGLVYPIKEIAQLAHRQGAKILVDDAQYIATHKEDVKYNQVDFMVFSGHKIGAPTGIGALYIKEPLIKKMLPYNVGGGTVQSVEIKGGKIRAEYLAHPFKFEAGIQHYAGIIGLKAAIDFLKKTGYGKITGRVEALSLYALGRLQRIPEVRLLIDYEASNPSSLICFCFDHKKVSLYDFNLFLNHGLKDYFIAVRCGHHCAQPLHRFLGAEISMRLSFFIYNTEKEIDIFCGALAGFLKRKK